MQRRGFLAGILAAGMAPAFVGAKVLMPVRALVLPAPLMWGEGSDDAFGTAMLTISMITNEALRILNDRLLFEPLLTREWPGTYSDRIADDGLAVRLRRPLHLVR